MAWLEASLITLALSFKFVFQHFDDQNPTQVTMDALVVSQSPNPKQWGFSKIRIWLGESLEPKKALSI